MVEELEKELKGKSLRELAKEQAKEKKLPDPTPKPHAKPKRAPPSNPATIKSDLTREALRRPSKPGRVNAPCVLELKQKKLSALMGTQKGDKVIIEGTLVDVSPQIAITVEKVTHHKTDVSSR